MGELGADIQIYRNDVISLKEIEVLAPEMIVISPGPCNPEKAGISINVARYFAGKIPLLGVCLGHQSLVVAFGGKITKADRLMHGKTSMIYHDNRTLFRNLPNPFKATRYHSLLVRKKDLPECFQISAWTDQDEIMGIRHKESAVEGVQFHPESILTESGKDLLKNFLQLYHVTP